MALVKGTNSFADVAEANAYFADRLNSTIWTTKSDSAKAQALITATSILSELPWAGTAISEDQPLAFPRILEYFDPKLGTWISVDNVTPSRIVTACMELANHLLTNEDVLTTSSSVQNLSIGSIRLDRVKKADIIPYYVRKFFQPLLVNGGNSSWWRAN